jgi:hypothetical protein
MNSNYIQYIVFAIVFLADIIAIFYYDYSVKKREIRKQG